MAIPKRDHERISASMKRLMPIIVQQRARDISEAGTVTLVKDLMSDVLGYDEYTDLTGEYAIRITFCDLAVKFKQKLAILCEVKVIGTNLDDRYIKHAIDYAANQAPMEVRQHIRCVDTCSQGLSNLAPRRRGVALTLCSTPNPLAMLVFPVHSGR